MALNRPPIPKLKPLARMFAGNVVQRETKTRDPIYRTPAYEVWRRWVIERAGGRCEARDDGRRCGKAMPYHRMFADHIQEIADNGAPLDPANGQCLCGAHHTIKTMKARALRLGRSP